MIYSEIKDYLLSKKHHFCINDATKILVIVPHPDDETIGMGGFIRKYSSNCTLMLVTNGCFGNPEYGREETIRIRNEEYGKALARLGVSSRCIYLGIDDRNVRKNLDRIKQAIDEDYDYIFVPNSNDDHIDHRAISKYISRLRQWGRIKSTVVEYEVWTPLKRPNLFVDITDIYKDKEEAIREYKSQLNHVAYDWGSLGLNRFRGMLNHCSYAEAYYIHKPKYDLFIEFLKKNKDRILED